MKKLSRSGFTAVETLLVLILLAILGFTGFYVYHVQHDANKTLDAAAKSTPATQTKLTSKPAVDTAFVEVIQADGSIQKATPDSIAKSDDQKAVLRAVHDSLCTDALPYVVVNYQIFSKDDLYSQAGNYAVLDTSCGKAAAMAEQLDSSGAKTYLHKKADATWVVDGAGQQALTCDKFDGKGYPLSISGQCFDDNNELRNPR